MSRLRIRNRGPRIAGQLAVLSAVAAAFSGCVAIKSQSLSQRAPGVVSLNLQICVSDRSTSGTACLPGTNTAENDNGQAVSTSAADGQLLVGFRVPDGTTAPQNFPNSDGRLNFALSPGYTDALTAEYVPIAGFHWVGYLSTQLAFNPADPSLRLTTINPEFVLPPGAGGGAFTGPFRWRAVVGARQIGAGLPANAPINCPVGGGFCFDSPTLNTTSGPASLPTHYTAVVSDFAVRTPAATSAGSGQVATFTFPLTSADARNLGAPTLSLSASTTLPGGQAQLGATTIAIPRDGETTATVSVAVPAGTPLGSYDVKLTATGNSLPAGAPIVRSATATLNVVDVIRPTVRIGTPADGATFTQGSRATADYECADDAGGSGVAACDGPVPSGAAIDTSTLGDKTFAVTATDNAGNSATVTRSYRVVSTPAIVVASAGQSRINFTLAFDFSASPRGTTLSRLQVKGAPSGSTLEVTCKGRSCPTQRLKGKRQVIKLSKRNASATVSLSPWLRKRLAPKTVLTIVVTKPGTVGMVKKFTIRASKRPVIATTCLRPGSKTASAPCQS